MTYQQYKDELLCLKHILCDLNAAVKYVSNEVNECLTDIHNAELSLGENRREPVYSRYVLRMGSKWASLLNQISLVRSYRSALAYWFWASRIGNPPVLR